MISQFSALEAFMKGTFLTLICICLLLILCACTPADSNSGSTLTIRIENVPVSADGHLVAIQIFEDIGGGIFRQSGYIDTTVTGNLIEATVKEYTLLSGKGSGTRYYTDNASCDIEIYIDIDGNGFMNDSGDVADAVNQSVVIDGNTIKIIQYNTLNIVL
jgi:hypothetical protein